VDGALKTRGNEYLNVETRLLLSLLLLRNPGNATRAGKWRV